jgi:hypothetical protein
MATITWTGASGGNYNTASNWSSGSVPTSGDTAIINFTGTVDVTQNDTIANLTLSSTAALDIGPGATYAATGTIANSGNIIVDQSGGNATRLLVASSKVTLTGGGTVTLTNNGNIGISGAASTDVLDNANNVIQGGGQLGAGSLAFTNEASGVVDGNNGNMTLNASTVTNKGLLEATSGGNLTITDAVNNSAGTIKSNGSQVFLSGATIAGGVLNSTTLTNIDVSANSTLDGSTNTVTNSGSLYVAPGVHLAVLGTIDNTGTILLDQSGGNQTQLLVSSPTVTLTGTGVVTLTNNPNIGIAGVGTTDVLVNATNLIQGGGQLGEQSVAFVNQSTVNANTGQMTLNALGVTNTGLLESTGSGNDLNITCTVNNVGGTIDANGGEVFLNTASIVGGLLTNSGTANLDVNTTAILDGSTHTVTISPVATRHAWSPPAPSLR